MDEGSLEPIPSPPHHVVREFCYRALPVLVFVLLGAATLALWQNRLVGSGVIDRTAPVRAGDESEADETLVSGLSAAPWSTVTGGLGFGTLHGLEGRAMRNRLSIERPSAR
jgi:hypothetical protein